MGCCQSRDSNELELIYSPKAQVQFTFGRNVTKNSSKSNYNSCNPPNINNIKPQLPENAYSFINGTNKFEEEKDKENLNPVNMSFALKEEDLRIDDTNTMGDSSKTTQILDKKDEETTKLPIYPMPEESKQIQNDSLTKKKEKLLEKFDKFDKFVKNIDADLINNQIDTRGITLEENKKTNHNHNDEHLNNRLNMVKHTNPNNGKFRPPVKSPTIIAKAHTLERQILAGSDTNAADPTGDFDNYTQIILDRPVQAKKKISRVYENLF